MSERIFELVDVAKTFDLGSLAPVWFPFGDHDRLRLTALDRIHLTLDAGESVALVGESGSGKTTLVRVLLGLVAPDRGEVLFHGRSVRKLAGDDLRAFHQRVAFIYQDARDSMNPRLRVGRIVSEAIELHRLRPPDRIERRVDELMERVGLPPQLKSRYPRQLSGGQVRRVAIARALASEPQVIMADEAVSGLDVSTQAQLLNLLRSLRDDMGLTLLFITHDLGVASYLCERVAVMYLGRIVEMGPTRAVLREPAHPYTRGLLKASPRFFQPISDTLTGEIPSPVNLPQGCHFAGRCPYVQDSCRAIDPELAALADGHSAACLFPLTRERTN
ncbi:MAG: ABC transporter ATP-binding protein [Proteobacteria bacterium]|nr:ABC transporter ATP-binding protein [Pseudomonadota bacterium]